MFWACCLFSTSPLILSYHLQRHDTCSLLCSALAPLAARQADQGDVSIEEITETTIQYVKKRHPSDSLDEAKYSHDTIEGPLGKGKGMGKAPKEGSGSVDGETRGREAAPVSFFRCAVDGGGADLA